MQFTGEEIICFNSILGGGELEWVELPPIPFGNREDYIKGTVGQMKEKGLVTGKDQLTQTGQLALRVLDEYKKAETKLRINNLRIAIVDKEIVVLIARVQEEYEMKFELKQNVMEAVMAAYPFLGGRQEGRVKREPRFMPYEEWENEIDSITEENSLMVSLCREKKLMEQRIYYWDEEGGCCYQPEKKTRHKKGPEDIRKELSALMEGEGEGNGRISH